MSSHADVVRAFLARRADAIEQALQRWAAAQGLTPTADDLLGRLNCFVSDDVEVMMFGVVQTRFTVEELWR